MIFTKPNYHNNNVQIIKNISNIYKYLKKKIFISIEFISIEKKEYL